MKVINAVEYRRHILHEDRIHFYDKYDHDIDDVINIADNNLTMPPKSTWFDPKPLDGLVVYEFS